MKAQSHLFLWILIFTNLSVLSPSVQAKKNGFVGGGSGVSKERNHQLEGNDGDTTESQIYLFDILGPDLEPMLEDPKDSLAYCPTSGFFEKTGYITIQANQFSEYSKMVELLDQWEKIEPSLSPMILAALHDVRWSCSRWPIPLAMGLDLGDLKIPPEQIFKLAIYNPILGVRLQRDEWLRLGATSRLGLLIHESLRHLQIRYSIPFSDLEIQTIVNQLLTISPSQSSLGAITDQLSKEVRDNLALLKSARDHFKMQDGSDRLLEILKANARRGGIQPIESVTLLEEYFLEWLPRLEANLATFFSSLRWTPLSRQKNE